MSKDLKIDVESYKNIEPGEPEDGGSRLARHPHFLRTQAKMAKLSGLEP